MGITKLSPELLEELNGLNLYVVPSGYLNTLEVQPTLEGRIKAAQSEDPELQEKKRLAEEKKAPGH